MAPIFFHKALPDERRALHDITSHMSSRYFLLSIAINQYPSGIPKLEGCLNDAESVKSCLSFILGPTPPSAIFSLTDAEATRSAIISGFFAHLVHNPEIRVGDPIIIHYSGHGGRAWLSGRHGLPTRVVETLCPADQSTLDDQGRVIPGIPDVTVNALLRILARHKGNNITFICDSCHSGGVDRGLDAECHDRGPHAEYHVARYSRETPHLPPNIDRDILVEADCAGEAFPFHGSYTSHILLAACAEEQRAYELSDGFHCFGAFTAALTSRLRRLKYSIEHVTYSELMASIILRTKPYYPQNPQNEATPCVFRLSAENGTFYVAAGEAHGVSVGTEMNIYRQPSALDCLGTLVVRHIDPVSATVQRRHGDDPFEVPANCWAGIRTWNTGDLRVFASPSVPLHLPDFQSVYRLHQAVTQEESHITLYLTSDGYITVERQDPLINTFSSHSVNSNLTVGPSLPSALQKIAHFYFHLGRQKKLPSNAFLDSDQLTVSKYVSLHMSRWDLDDEGMSRGRSKVSFKDNTFYLDAESTRRYSLTIVNKSHLGFYPYLFYFNPADYSIKALFLPPSTAIEPPLKHRGSIAIGDGFGETLNFTPEGTGSDGGFFKLIVCTRNINLIHIAQASPFETITTSGSSPASTSYGSDRLLLDVESQRAVEKIWSASLVAVKFGKRRRGFGLFAW
ncbi:caspase domain-containing protein [Mycena capillaripes]|nr:caspase domain-containing protein [Mycena capillaripes]